MAVLIDRVDVAGRLIAGATVTNPDVEDGGTYLATFRIDHEDGSAPLGDPPFPVGGYRGVDRFIEHHDLFDGVGPSPPQAVATTASASAAA